MKTPADSPCISSIRARILPRKITSEAKSNGAHAEFLCLGRVFRGAVRTNKFARVATVVAYAVAGHAGQIENWSFASSCSVPRNPALPPRGEPSFPCDEIFSVAMIGVSRGKILLERFRRCSPHAGDVPFARMWAPRAAHGSPQALVSAHLAPRACPPANASRSSEWA
jgi:hypothetical protein